MLKPVIDSAIQPSLSALFDQLGPLAAKTELNWIALLTTV